MSNRKALKGAIAAIASVATLGALAAPALANETSTYNLNGKSVAELAQHGGAQRIAAIGNGTAKNVILFIGDGMGDSEITVARDYLKGQTATSKASTQSASRQGSVTSMPVPASTPPSRWAATAVTVRLARMTRATSTPIRIRANLPE